jgi:xanthine dehydrogenase accessory factor
MKGETIRRLIEDRAARRAVILATNLKTGAERLVYADCLGGEAVIGEAAREVFLSDRARIVETAEGPIFLNVQNPPLRLVITGAVHIAQMLIPVATLAGFSVTVVDPRGGFATEERFPGVDLHVAWPDEVADKMAIDRRTAFVALTHDPKIDDPALRIALAGECFYIGALGSKKTHGGRIERLTQAGIDAASLERIHAPIGLAIGARSPAEIAISIMAEIINALRQGRIGRA